MRLKKKLVQHLLYLQIYMQDKQKPTKLPFFRKIPPAVYIAFSGGVDSTVLLHRLMQRGIVVDLLFVHHQTQWCDTEMQFAYNAAKQYGIGCVVKRIDRYDKTKHNTSMEFYWSTQRNSIFQEMDRPVCTGHHLDDAVEWYVMSSMQGQSKLLCYRNNNVLRPFLCVEKQKIYSYAAQHNVEYLQDPTNEDNNFNLRNKVRNQLLPEITKVFPGITKTVRKLIISKEHRLELDNRI